MGHSLKTELLLAALLVPAWINVPARDPFSGDTPSIAASHVTSSTLIDVCHPGVLISSGGLTELRDALTTDTYRRNIYETSVRAIADDWLSRSITIPPRSGYYHDFVCTDGTRLVWPDELKHCEPITPAQAYVCPACGSHYTGEKQNGAVRYLQHTALMAAARNLALVGALEHNVRYSAKAVEILSAYAYAYPGRHTGLTKGGILYQSLDEAVHFIYLAQAYDLVAATDLISSSTREHIQRSLLWECAEGLIACGTGGNWGSWHLSAVGVIGFATGHQGYIDYGLREFKKQIAGQLGADGLWPESVHTYHFYPMRGFLQLAEAAMANGTDLYRWEAAPGRSLKSMFTSPIQYAYPNLQLPAINDGWFWSFLPLDVYELGYNRLRLPELGWVVKESRRRNTASQSRSPDGLDVWSLIHGIPVPDNMQAPALRSTNFQTLGICTLRLGLPADREKMVTFDYGPHLGHGQADKMGVTFFANNRLLLPDYGTPSYGSAILPYYRGTSGHNTIMVDGKDQAYTRNANLLAFVDEPGLKAAVAETTETAEGVNWRRGVFLTADYLLIIDRLKSDAIHRYDNLIHVAADRSALNGGFEIETDIKPPADLPYIAVTRSVSDRNGALKARWLDGTMPVLQTFHGSDPPPYAYEAIAPGEDGSTTIPCVVHNVNADNALMATLLLPDTETTAAVKVENGQVTVYRGGSKDIYCATPDDRIVVELSGGKSPRTRKINFSKQ